MQWATLLLQFLWTQQKNKPRPLKSHILQGPAACPCLFLVFYRREWWQARIIVPDFYLFIYLFMDIPHPQPQPQPQQTCLHFHILHMGPTKYHSSFLFFFFWTLWVWKFCEKCWGFWWRSVKDWDGKVTSEEVRKLEDWGGQLDSVGNFIKLLRTFSSIHQLNDMSFFLYFQYIYSLHFAQKKYIYIYTHTHTHKYKSKF